MECLRCGSARIVGQPISYMASTSRCQCLDCGFQWLYSGKQTLPGSPQQPGIDFAREVKDFWRSGRVYAANAVMSWLPASLLMFMLTVRSPWQAATHLKDGWLLMLLTVIGAGILLGFVLATAIFISGAGWPQTRAMHVLLPLTCAALLGAIQGFLWGYASFVFAAKDIALREVAARTIIGAVLAMGVTKTIIVRSARYLRKIGLRPVWQ